MTDPDLKQRIFDAVLNQYGYMLLDSELNAVLGAVFPADAREIIRDTVKRCIEAPPNRSETDFALDVADAVLAALGGKP